jgi:hypothetical protein
MRHAYSILLLRIGWPLHACLPGAAKACGPTCGRGPEIVAVLASTSGVHCG